MAKVRGKFYNYDDELCREVVNEELAISPKAYILIYSRRKKDYSLVDMISYLAFKKIPPQKINSQYIFPGEPIKCKYGIGYLINSYMNGQYEYAKVKLQYGYAELLMERITRLIEIKADNLTGVYFVSRNRQTSKEKH